MLTDGQPITESKIVLVELLSILLDELMNSMNSGSSKRKRLGNCTQELLSTIARELGRDTTLSCIDTLKSDMWQDYQYRKLPAWLHEAFTFAIMSKPAKEVK